MIKAIELLHRGIYSEIWSAYRTDLETKHVVKVLSAVGTDEAAAWDYERLFHNEAKVLARLAHPSIIRFYDLFEDASGRPTILLEDGGVALSKIPAAALSMDALAAVCLKVLSAILYLQQPLEIGGAFFQAVIHGDIKPENILIGKDCAKLIDFGAACIPNDLHARAVIGTPKYLAPWRKANQSLTWRDDVFALGITMTELADKAQVRGKNDSMIRQIFESLQEIESTQKAIDSLSTALRVRDLGGLIGSLNNTSLQRG